MESQDPITVMMNMIPPHHFFFDNQPTVLRRRVWTHWAVIGLSGISFSSVLVNTTTDVYVQFSIEENRKPIFPILLLIVMYGVMNLTLPIPIVIDENSKLYWRVRQYLPRGRGKPRGALGRYLRFNRRWETGNHGMITLVFSKLEA